MVQYIPVDLWSQRAGINNRDWRNMALLGTVGMLKHKTLFAFSLFISQILYLNVWVEYKLSLLSPSLYKCLRI